MTADTPQKGKTMCKHDASHEIRSTLDMYLSKCDTECEKIFLSYKTSDGMTHTVTIDALAALEAVAKAARNGVGLDDALDALAALAVIDAFEVKE